MKEQRIKEQFANKSNVNFVAISQHIQYVANQSLILNKKKVHMIHNIVDSNFRFQSKQKSREILKINDKERVIVIGAISLNTYYKGFHLLFKILHILCKYNPLLVYFGRSCEEELSSLPLRRLYLGKIYEPSFLSKVYGAADIFLSTSIDEAFGKTVVEAMASGTPATCFEGTGPAELIKMSPYSLVSPQYDCFHMANIASRFLYSPISDDKRLLLANYAKIYTAGEHSAIKYQNLYKSITQKH